MTNQVKGAAVGESAPLQGEMEELKREMRSAQWSQWVLDHQKQIIKGIVVLLVVLIAAAFWMEHQRSQQAAAATLYQQAINSKDAAKEQALLERLKQEFSSTSYAAMAEMLLVKLDSKHAEQHLRAVMKHPKAMREWRWQAKMDLASMKLEAGDKAAVRTLLTDMVGRDYRQLRFYLLAMAAQSESDKQAYLKKADAAPSHDPQLKQKIQSMLAAHG